MPNGSMKKFLADSKNPIHGGQPLSWPGTSDGFPYRGPVPDLRGDEYETGVKLALDYHSDRFCLWDRDEHSRFDLIMQYIVNGLFMQHKRYDRWSDEHCGMIVWLEWVQIYGEFPGVGQTHGQTIQHSSPGQTFSIAHPGQNGNAQAG